MHDRSSVAFLWVGSFDVKVFVHLSAHDEGHKVGPLPEDAGDDKDLEAEFAEEKARVRAETL